MPSTRTPTADRLIGEMVTFWREGAKLTQKDLATKLGCSYQNLQNYEAGRTRVSVSLLVQVMLHTNAHRADLEYLISCLETYYQ